MLIWSKLHRIAPPLWYLVHLGYTVEDIAKDIVKANVALTKKDQGLENCRTLAHFCTFDFGMKPSDGSSEYIRSHQSNPRNIYHLNILEHTWTYLNTISNRWWWKRCLCPTLNSKRSLTPQSTTNSTNSVDTVPPNLIQILINQIDKWTWGANCSCNVRKEMGWEGHGPMPQTRFFLLDDSTEARLGAPQSLSWLVIAKGCFEVYIIYTVCFRVTDIQKSTSLTTKKSHSKEASQQRELTEVPQQRDLTAKRAEDLTEKEISQPDFMAKRASFSHLQLSLFEGSLAPKLHFYKLKLQLNCGKVAAIPDFSRFWRLTLSLEISSKRLSKSFKIVFFSALASRSRFGAGFGQGKLPSCQRNWSGCINVALRRCCAPSWTTARNRILVHFCFLLLKLMRCLGSYLMSPCGQGWAGATAFLALASWRWCYATARCLGSCIMSPWGQGWAGVFKFLALGQTGWSSLIWTVFSISLPTTANGFFSALRKIAESHVISKRSEAKKKVNTLVLKCVKTHNSSGPNAMYIHVCISH